jgi:hypothetical protein
MRCDWQESGNRDASGVGDVYCSRCDRFIYQTPNTADEIRGDYSCMTWPRYWEIGWWLAYLIALVGLRKEAWSNFLVAIGLGPCKCPWRIKMLNNLGYAASSIAGLFLVRLIRDVVGKAQSAIAVYVGRRPK